MSDGASIGRMLAAASRVIDRECAGVLRRMAHKLLQSTKFAAIDRSG